jgi:hypothetical protein
MARNWQALESVSLSPQRQFPAWRQFWAVCLWGGKSRSPMDYALGENLKFDCSAYNPESPSIWC